MSEPELFPAEEIERVEPTIPEPEFYVVTRWVHGRWTTPVSYTALGNATAILKHVADRHARLYKIGGQDKPAQEAVGGASS